MSHTPGPWKAMPMPEGLSEDFGRWWVRGPVTDETQYQSICTLSDWETLDRQAANARLIAAAPELLKAAEAAERELVGTAYLLKSAGIMPARFWPESAALSDIRAAIRAAKGDGAPYNEEISAYGFADD